MWHEGVVFVIMITCRYLHHESLHHGHRSHHPCASSRQQAAGTQVRVPALAKDHLVPPTVLIHVPPKNDISAQAKASKPDARRGNNRKKGLFGIRLSHLSWRQTRTRALFRSDCRWCFLSYASAHAPRRRRRRERGSRSLHDK